MVATVLNLSCAATLGPRSELTLQSRDRYSTIITVKKMVLNERMQSPIILCCSNSNTTTLTSSSEAVPAMNTDNTPAPLRRRRRRYRKQYPGEKKGITEEMRFVAMRLRKTEKVKNSSQSDRKNDGVDDSSHRENDGVSDRETQDDGVDAEDSDESISLASSDEDNGNDGETWKPSMEGFLKYLVDSKLVFDTVERIIDESSDVSYAYFRKTGLERAGCLSKDLEWFSQQDIVIPEPSNPGVTYVNYLEELAEKAPPLFLCHFYNIYFSHIAGGQVIAKQVSERLLEERELEFYSWDGDAEELLRVVREKLNMVGEHWSRDEKNKCLREATKSFRFLGQIVRLIIL